METPTIIHIDSRALQSLVDEVIKYVKLSLTGLDDKWITTEETMRLLAISSKTTLQTYRNNGKIRYSRINAKTILYQRQSVLDFIEQNVKETF